MKMNMGRDQQWGKRSHRSRCVRSRQQVRSKRSSTAIPARRFRLSPASSRWRRSGGAEAQQSSLPPVNVDAPVGAPASRRFEADARPGPCAQCAAPRRAAASRPRSSARRRFPNAGRLSADRNPYADRGRALQGRSPAGVGQVSRAAAQHAEDRSRCSARKCSRTRTPPR